MRIAHVTPFYTPVIGGVEDVVKHIAEYMAKKGYEVYVITYNRLRKGGAGSLPREEIINGVHVIRLKPAVTWSHGSYSSELPEALRRLRPDIVHVHVWRHPHVLQLARLKEKFRFKMIIQGHSPFYTFKQIGIVIWTYHKFIDAILKNALKKYDAYIAITPYEKDIIAKVFKVQLEKIFVIPVGIDEDRCPNYERCDSVVLYLGRISKEKNVILLVKAMRYVIKEVRDVKLLIAGPDEGMIKKILDYSRRHGVEIRYLGVVSNKLKHKLYAMSTVYALPSHYEGFGITLLEAGIHGTPSVITGYGGQLCAAPPGVASLWAKSDPKDFARAITILLSNKDLYKKLSQGARKWALKHLWSTILPKYNELYTHILKT